MELRKQYQELVQFCGRWYDEHVIEQDERGRGYINRIYKRWGLILAP